MLSSESLHLFRFSILQFKEINRSSHYDCSINISTCSISYVLFQLRVRQSVCQAAVILPRSLCLDPNPQVTHPPNSPHSKANNSPPLRHRRSLWVKRRKKNALLSWLCSLFRAMKLNARLILTRIIELRSSLI